MVKHPQILLFVLEIIKFCNSNFKKALSFKLLGVRRYSIIHRKSAKHSFLQNPKPLFYKHGIVVHW